VLALLAFRYRGVRKGLQFHDGGRTVDTPEVDDVVASGNTARQGQNLRLGGSPVFGQLNLERDLVTTELCSFLIELGCFGARGIQLAAQFTIAGLQHLKETDVLDTFGMEFLP
jgi:hypothetical protein